MIDPRNLDTLSPTALMQQLKAATPMGKGLGASPGAACGKIVFTADDAEAWAARGEKVVLVTSWRHSTRGYHRYEVSTGYFYSSWWYDITRCSCCPWYGYMLCIRLWRYRYGTRRTRSSHCWQGIP